MCWLHDSWQGKKKRNHFIGFPCWERKIGEYSATISFLYMIGYAERWNRQRNILPLINYKTSLLFYLIEILDGRYPENNICFLPFIRVSRRDCLNYTNPKECQNRLDRTVQFRQGSLDWYTCAFTRFPNEPVDGEHLLKGNRKKKQKSFYVTTTAISFSVFFFTLLLLLLWLCFTNMLLGSCLMRRFPI